MTLVELTEMIVKSLVSDPDSISVKEFPSDDEIIIEVVVLAGLGYFVFTNYVSKEKDLVFEARIKEVTVNNNIYTVLVEEYDKKKKEYTVEYEFEINKDTKIVYNNEDSTADKLKANQKVTITSSDVMLPSEPAKLSNVKKIVISKD